MLAGPDTKTPIKPQNEPIDSSVEQETKPLVPSTIAPTHEASVEEKIQAKKTEAEIKRNTRFVILAGPVVGALYLLASLFPTFSAIIASIIIGAAISFVSYGIYQLYIKGAQAAQAITTVTVDFQKGKYKELTDKAQSVMTTSITTLQTFNNSVNTIATELTKSTDNVSGLLLEFQLLLRENRLLNGKAHQNIVACALPDFHNKGVYNLKPNRFAFRKSNTAFVTKTEEGKILCKFLNDYDKIMVIPIDIEMKELSLDNFVLHNQKKILEMINVHIISSQVASRKEELISVPSTPQISPRNSP